jgi:hypothetical protein
LIKVFNCERQAQPATVAVPPVLTDAPTDVVVEVDASAGQGAGNIVLGNNNINDIPNVLPPPLTPVADPTESPSKDWPHPEKCVPGLIGTNWGEQRDGWQPRLPFPTDPSLLTHSV